MSRRIIIAALLLFVACSTTTTFTSTWKAPGTEPVSPIGRKVAAVFISPDESQRRAGENALAADLTQRGAIGIASFTVVPDRADGEAARQRLRDAGANGAVVMRIVRKDQEITYPPGMSVPVSSRRFGPYWGDSWRRVQEPGTFTTNTIVAVETLVYALEPDTLLWASSSRSANPRDLDALVREVASATAREMANQGLLAAR
jgi:hypothetical protein